MKPHLHFMGIGGVSMSGLARHYHAEGFAVSGCDAVEGAEVARLRAAGIPVHIGHHPEHVHPGDGAPVDVLVHTMAIPNRAVAHSLEEVAAAERRGVRVVKRIELLAELFASRRAVGISGTHGKSTTTGMCATLLLALSDDPSVQLGASLPAIDGNMRFGRGPLLVAEVDESDPGFAALAPEVAVLTNLEDDHIAGEYDERRNYHASLEELESAARAFAHNAATVIHCGDWPALAPLVADHPRALSYGFAADADYRIAELELGAAHSSFALHTPTGARHRVRLAVPGRYNALNATAALAAAETCGLDIASGLEALAAFPGVGRRWQRWGEVAGALVIDDYAHHPTEVAATLRAARHTGRRVRAVLQPHRWVRTARHWPALADAAALADEVIVLDVYAAGEAAIAGVGPELIVARLRDAGCDARHLSAADAERYLASTLGEDQLVITLGAGDVWRVAAALVREASYAGG